MEGITRLPALNLLSRIIIGAFGLVSFVVGVIAVFQTESSGAGVLLTIGALLIVFSIVAHRVERIDVGGNTITFAKAWEKFDQAEISDLVGDSERAKRLREDAWTLVEQAASEFWQLRNSMPSGHERTMALEAVMSRAQNLGAAHGFSRGQAKNWLASENEAHRAMALALMKSDPDPRDIELLLTVIDDPKSAFEQYHALLLLDTLFDGLALPVRARVVDIISSVPGLTSNPDQGRNKIRERIIHRWTKSQSL